MASNDALDQLAEVLGSRKEKKVNWAAQDTQIKHVGKEMILPADPAKMTYDDAIETLKRVKEQESQKFDVSEVVLGAPWDAIVAIYKAMQEIYGVVTSHSIQSWFGDIKPQFVTIITGPGERDRLQVPKGLMRVPGVSEPFYLDFFRNQGAAVYGTLNKADQTRLVEIANVARRIIRTESVYKGKAIRLGVDSNGALNTGVQPEFLDLANVSESDMIHTAETGALIRTNIFTPLKKTEACRKHKVPLKRGILLEGRYGTGKSLTARVAAKVAIDNGWTFIMLDRSQGLKAAIEFGRAYQPCMIFGEDIDRAADRSSESVNDLVNLIDGVVTKDMEMMTVLTTNFIEKVDQSLLRPGRFDAIISIQVPDSETAVKLIKAYARDLIDPSADLKGVGDTISGQIPAIIREVVERAKLSMFSDDRTSLTVEDLQISAVGMKRQMALMEPKATEETPKDKLWIGFQGLVKDMSLGGSFDDLMSEITDTQSLVRGVHQDLDEKVQGAKVASTAAASSASEAKKEIVDLKTALKAKKVA